MQAYSDAYLTGAGETAYGLLSTRCQGQFGEKSFQQLVAAAGQTYGSKLPMKTFDATVSGDLARVTYTYSVSAIDQKDQPWTREDGSWHYDAC